MFFSSQIYPGVRCLKLVIKNLATIFPLCLLLNGCERHDVKLHNQVVGTWIMGSGFEMTLTSDGNFHSQLTRTNKELNYYGAWIASNGFLIETLTNRNALNWNISEQMGSVDRYKVISVDENQLLLDFNGEKISYARRR